MAELLRRHGCVWQQAETIGVNFDPVAGRQTPDRKDGEQSAPHVGQ
jgi:hypothetical protein